MKPCPVLTKLKEEAAASKESVSEATRRLVRAAEDYARERIEAEVQEARIQGAAAE